MLRALLFSILLLLPEIAYSAQNKTPVVETKKSQQIEEITSFAKKIINQALHATRNKDKSKSYKEISTLVTDNFDSQNMLKFAMARAYKLLSPEQKEYMLTYSNRSIILMFMEKFFFKSLRYEISRITERKNIFDVYLVIHSVEGLQVDNLVKDIKGDDAKDIEVVLSIKAKNNRYILQDVKAFEISFLNHMRDFFQNTLKNNNNDIDTMVDDLLTDLDNKEREFRATNRLPASLFPPIKLLLELE